MPTIVALSIHFESLVKEQVDVGRFNNMNEAVRARLRSLEDQEEVQALNLQELRKAIAAGTASGLGQDADEVFDRLIQKYQMAR